MCEQSPFLSICRCRSLFRQTVHTKVTQLPPSVTSVGDTHLHIGEIRKERHTQHARIHCRGSSHSSHTHLISPLRPHILSIAQASKQSLCSSNKYPILAEEEGTLEVTFQPRFSNRSTSTTPPTRLASPHHLSISCNTAAHRRFTRHPLTRPP